MTTHASTKGLATSFVAFVAHNFVAVILRSFMNYSVVCQLIIGTLKPLYVVKKI